MPIAYELASDTYYGLGIVTIVLWTSLFSLSLLSLLSGRLIVSFGLSFCLHCLIVPSVDILLLLM